MSQTNNLQLNKHDNPSTNENPFDIENYLNANWDKIDVKAGELDASLQESEDNISTLQERVSTNEDNIETLQSQVTTAESDIETLQTELTELQEDVQNLRNASYKVSGSGTNFSLNNTTKNKFIEFLPGGNTEQTQLSGKNLAVSEFQDKISFSGSGNNRTVVSSNYKFSQIIKVEPNTTYTVNGDYSSLSDQRIRIFFFNEYPNIGSVSTKYLFSDISSAYTFTTETNTNYIVLYGVVSTPADVILPNLQLEEGTTATDYEPYCGGIPSPNPEYPQPIYNVTGNVANKIENKNLLNLLNGEYSNNGITAIVENGKITLNGTATNNSFVYIPFLFKFKGSTTYTLSSNNTKINSNIIMRIDGNILSFNLSTLNASRTYTFGNEVNSTNIVLRITSGEILNNFIIIPQLEEGSTATSYEEHQEQNLPLTLGNIELCKIDEAKDYFYKNNGKWYLHKEIGKTIFDGSNDETWRSESFGTFYRYSTDISNAKIYNASEDFVGYSNYFYKSVKVLTVSTIDLGQFIQYRNSKSFYFASDKNGLNDFKTWLSTHNTEVYYLLATPIDTEITDTTLIEQLEAIEKVMSYNDQTNIFSESDEVGMIIDATAVGDINKVINNLLSN